MSEATALTPDERAELVLQSFEGCIGCTPPDLARKGVAGAIREAVLEDRRRAAGVVAYHFMVGNEKSRDKPSRSWQDGYAAMMAILSGDDLREDA